MARPPPAELRLGMTVFKIVNEQGRWLMDMRLGPASWKPGDRIPRGRDTLEVVEVRADGEKVTLVIRGQCRGT